MVNPTNLFKVDGYQTFVELSHTLNGDLGIFKEEFDNDDFGINVHKELERYPLELSYAGQSYLSGIEKLHGLESHRSRFPLLRSLLEVSSKLWYTVDASATAEERTERKANLMWKFLYFSEKKAGKFIGNREGFDDFKAKIESIKTGNPPGHLKLFKTHCEVSKLFPDAEEAKAIYHILSGWSHGLPGVVQDFDPKFAEDVHFRSLSLFIHACFEMFKIYDFDASEELKRVTSQGIVLLDGTGYTPWNL